MVSDNPLAAAEARQRIERIRIATGCRKKAAFATWIGANSPQAVNNWTKRGMSREGAVKIAKATGASLEYLLTGEGEPFLGKPKPYPGAGVMPDAERLRGTEEEVDALSTVLAAVLQVISAKQRAVGLELETALRALPVATDSQRQVLEGAILAVELGLGSTAPESRRAAPAGSRDKPLQRDR